MKDDYDLNIEKLSFKIIKYYYNFYLKKLNKAQRLALEYYKGMGYLKIQKYLLENDLGSREEENDYYTTSYRLLNNIKEIDSIFRMVKPYNQNIKVYRGMANCKSIFPMVINFEKMELGTTFKFPTYLSTSLNINKSVNFMGNPSKIDKKKKGEIVKLGNDEVKMCDNLARLFGEKYYFMMVINIPKGNKFIYLENFYKKDDEVYINNWENEILLSRNSKLKLVKRYDEVYKKFTTDYKVKNIEKNSVKFIPARVYEFDYEGYDDEELVIEKLEKVHVQKYFLKPKNMKKSEKFKEDIQKEFEELEKQKFLD